MLGRLKGNKVELHITLLPETIKELEALMKHERETTPSSCIDRRSTRDTQDFRAKLRRN